MTMSGKCGSKKSGSTLKKTTKKSAPKSSKKC